MLDQKILLRFINPDRYSEFEVISPYVTTLPFKNNKNKPMSEQYILIKLIDNERYVEVHNVTYDQIIEHSLNFLCDMLDNYVNPLPFRDCTILNSKIDKIIEKLNEKRINE